MKKFSYTLTLSSLLLMTSAVHASHSMLRGNDDNTATRKVGAAAVTNAAQFPPLDNQPPAGRGKRRGGAPILSQVQTIPQSPQPAAAAPDALTFTSTVGPADREFAATHAGLMAQLTEQPIEQFGNEASEQPPLQVFQGFSPPDPATQQPAALLQGQSLAPTPQVVAQTSVTSAPVVRAIPPAQVAAVSSTSASAAPTATATSAVPASAEDPEDEKQETAAVVDPTSNGVFASVWRKLYRATFSVVSAGGKVQQDMFVDMTPQKLHEIISGLDIQNLSASKLIGKRFVNKTGNQNAPHFFDGYGVILDFECGTLELQSKGFGNSDVAIAAWNPSEENPLRFLRTLITNQHGNSVMEKGPVKPLQMCGTYPVMAMEMKAFPQNTYVKLVVMRVEKDYVEIEYNRVLQNILRKRIKRSLNPSEEKEE